MRAPLVAVCLLTCCLSVAAQTDTSRSGASLGQILSSDISTGLSDAGRIVTAPLHFNAKEWMVTAGVVGGTAFLFTFDRTARVEAARNQSDAAHSVFNVGREYGREIYGLSLAGGLYAGGIAFQRTDIRTTGRMLGESIVIAGVINIALKSLFGRSRPQTGEGPYEFRGFQTSNEHLSLPSGHSTVAFSVSSVLARRIGNPYASAALYSLAGVTALSRVYTDDHWISDTFLGAAIGTAVGLSVSNRGEETPILGLRIQPSLSGLHVEYLF